MAAEGVVDLHRFCRGTEYSVESPQNRYAKVASRDVQIVVSLFWSRLMMIITCRARAGCRIVDLSAELMGSN